MQKIYLWILAILGIINVAAAAPHHHDDGLDPVITFLKQLRKARKHAGGGGGILGNRDEDVPLTSQQSQQSSSQRQPTVPILFPSGGGGSGSGSNLNDQRITADQILASFPRPTSSPQDITRINSGVSTILNGVARFDLGQILRGAFIFPTNNNVKSVANNVLDTIFGPPGGGGGGGGSSSSAGGDSSLTRN